MLKTLSSRLESLFVLVALGVLLGTASPHFLTGDNLLNVLQQSSINALLGIGLTFVIISGGIDLSVGSILALCGLVVADLLVAGHSMTVAIAAGLGAGLLCGMINGLVTTLARIPPFITTLGMMLVARSVAKVYSGSQPISGLPEGFRALSGSILGIPVLVVVVAVFYFVAHAVLTRTKLGRYTYAIGDNEQAAWLSGVPTGVYKIAIYALSGLLAGVAAVLMTSRLNAASPLAGEMYELYAIAAAVIGGVSLMGGEGRVVGTLIGALIMGMLRNGLNLLNVPSAWEGVVVGSVLVIAVVADRARHRAPAGPAAEGMRRYRGRIMALGAFVVLTIAASFYRTVQMEAADAPGLTIAFVPKSVGDPFWVTMQKAAEAEGARHNARIITQAASRETDVEGQYQVVENFIERGVDAILLAPAGSKELIPAIKKANDANIPILILDSDIDHEVAAQVGAKTLTYIGSDNFLGGSIAGHYVAEAIGDQGKIAIIEGTPGHESTDQRRLGFLKAIAEHPKVMVVASQTANAERERGFTVAQNLLQSQPDLVAIFAANDQMALGALEAVDSARKLDTVRVVGFDASPDAVKNIISKRMLGSVAQFPSEMGRLGVLHAVRMLNDGEAPDAVIHTKVEMIDADNVEAFAETAGDTRGVRVGLVVHAAKNPYWKELIAGARRVADEEQITILVRAPEHAYDVEKQFELVSGLIAQGVDGIILAPAGARTMALAARLANQADIPMVIVDSNLNAATLKRLDAEVVGFIGSDNRAGGEVAAAHVVSLLPKGGRVAILDGVPDNASTRQRSQGFRAALASHANIRIVAAQSAYAEAGLAKVIALSMLSANPDLDLIFACNGLMAIGAADAVEEAGLRQSTKVVGFDATPAVVAAIDAGRIAATVAQRPRDMGGLAVHALMRHILGGEQAAAPARVFTKTSLVTKAAGSVEP